jgi:hypothetical protein
MSSVFRGLKGKTPSVFGQLFGREAPALMVMFGGLALSALAAVFLMAGKRP